MHGCMIRAWIGDITLFLCVCIRVCVYGGNGKWEMYFRCIYLFIKKMFLKNQIS